MKRIAILEFIGCQKPSTVVDYPQAIQVAKGDLPQEKIISSLLGEGDSMLLTLAGKFLQDEGYEVHCCRHELNRMPDLREFSSHGWRSFDSIIWHPIRTGEDMLARWVEVARKMDMGDCHCARNR